MALAGWHLNFFMATDSEPIGMPCKQRERQEAILILQIWINFSSLTLRPRIELSPPKGLTDRHCAYFQLVGRGQQES